jgi:hypothetical protein
MVSPSDLRRFEIDHEFEFGRLSDGQVARISTLEDPVDIRGYLSDLMVKANAVRHQTA